MRTKLKDKILLFVASFMLIAMLSSCSTKDIEAAKQIEEYIQGQEQQQKRYTNIEIDKLDTQNAMDIIAEFASDKYKGRKTGTAENEKAVQYIADYFNSIGLESPSSLNNYLQPYSQSVTLLEETPKLELIDKDGNTIKNFEYPKNFVYTVLSDSTEDIQLNAPMKVMNSIADIQSNSLENNSILLFSLKAQGRSQSMQLMREAYPTKAGAIIVEMDVKGENSRFSDLKVIPMYSKNWGKYYKPVIGVDTLTFAELAAAAQESRNIKLQCSYRIDEKYKASNVVGYIPGADEKNKDEFIIIGGHMDHVGDNFNGTYNPGALDNASGTAAMMEIARVISQNPVKPSKSIVFIAFNGEEYHLTGSEYYADNPVFPLKKAVMINLDMVGSSYIMPLSIANGDGFAPDLKFEFLEIAKSLGVDAISSNITASDHTNFAIKDVPSILLINMDDMHGYHSPNDTLEDVDDKRLEEIIKLVLYYIDKKAY
ncbi:MAG: peptidase family protein [Clostridia bacterium]|jgi:hypothetical protein|nr:peptidase family protein [Clostridia bacterium]